MWYILTLVVALILNFYLPRLVPGNPVQSIVAQMNQGMTDTNRLKAAYESFYQEFGLDKPLIVQFLTYVKNLFSGNMGISFSQYPRKVSEILGSSIPWTIGIQLPAIIVGWTLGNLLGALAAYKRGTFDRLTFPVSMFLSSIPAFVFSLILLYTFSVTLKWFPIAGSYGQGIIPGMNWTFISSVLYHHFLPFMGLSLIMIGGQAIGMRSMSLYELNADYVLYAKLMGVSDGRVVRYVFRNAVLPQITGLALSLGTMVSGALITEQVFSYPGVGRMLFTAIRNSDYTLISGCTLVVTLTVLVANFIIEIIYGFIDPRVKSAQTEG